jgi:hypothetical protein
MKKFVGIIISIMMLLISISFISTNSFGDEVPSVANVLDNSNYINAWIEIYNMDSIKVWDQRYGQDNLRSDSYINDGEKLIINVIIFDANGIYPSPPSHTIDAYLSPDDDYLGTLVFQNYPNPEDITRALFNLIYTMDNPDIVQCKHDVYVTSEDVNDSEIYEIYDSLYINPYVTASFSHANVAWTGLLPGSIGIPADSNTYGYAIGAFCYVNDDQEWVNIDYNLSINGTDMTQVGVTDFIPCENISYFMVSPPPTPLLETYTFLGVYNATDSPLPFNFFIDVPSVIQSGAYTGEINFVFQVI